MKQLLIFISLFLAIVCNINAQSIAANQFNGRLQMTAVSNVSDSIWSITGYFTNSVNKYTTTQIAVNDKFFCQIGANTYVGRISVINSASDVTKLITFRVICNYPNPPNNIGAIIRTTSNGYPVFVDGLPNALQAGIQNYFATLINTNAAGNPCEKTITKTSHGFRKGTPVKRVGGTYVRPTNDTIIPDFIVVDSLTANTFKVSTCGIYTSTLADGLYWYTSASPGYSLTQDTVKVPLFQVLNDTMILNPIVGFNLMSGSGDVTSSVLADTAAAIRADFPSGSVVIQASAPADTVSLWLDNSAGAEEVWQLKRRIQSTWKTIQWYDPIGKVFSSLPPIYVLATGQSNMLGYNGGGGAVGDTVQDARVVVWDNSSKWVISRIRFAPYRTDSTYNNLAFNFAKKLAQNDNRIVRLILAAFPGQSIEYWKTGNTGWTTITNYITNSGSSTKKFDVVLWHQGESNGDGFASSAVCGADPCYKDSLYSLISKIQNQTWADKNTKFIAGGLRDDLSTIYPTASGRQDVLEGLNSDTLVTTGFADAHGLTGDYIHFSNSAMPEFGAVRYWNTYKALPKLKYTQKEVLIKNDSLYGQAGFYFDTEVASTYIYACNFTTNRVSIYDLAFPRDTLKTFGVVRSGLTYRPAQIKLHDNFLYVLCPDDVLIGGNSALFKYDITDPLNPNLLWSTLTGAGFYPNSMTFNDTLVYVARVNDVLIYSTFSGNFKASLTGTGFGNNVLHSNDKLYVFGGSNYVLDTAILRVYNTSTTLPTLANSYKSKTDSTFLGGFVDNDFVFTLSHYGITVLRTSNLSVVKRYKLKDLNQDSYLSFWNKRQAKVLKYADYVFSTLPNSRYLYQFSYPEFNLVNQFDLGQNGLDLEHIGNTFHFTTGDDSGVTKKLRKGLLNH